MNSINNSTKIELLCELAHKRVEEECINDSRSRYIKKNIGNDIDLNALTLADETLSSIIWELELSSNNNE